MPGKLKKLRKMMRKKLFCAPSAANLRPVEQPKNSINGGLPLQQLSDTAARNLREWWAAPLPKWARTAMDELLAAKIWTELENRFFRELTFGTAGLRGRCIGEWVAPAEGNAAAKEFFHGAVGSACMNDFNVVRAAAALFHHCSKWMGAKKDLLLVIAYDVRHFSKRFAEIAADTWNLLGGNAICLDGPRSTPQLSFAVRRLGATAGIVITASHNPREDNGFKVYFSDGAQVVDPHASAIMDHFSRVSVADACAMLQKIDGKTAKIRRHGTDNSTDEPYLEGLCATPVDPGVLRYLDRPIVYTSLHGTGIVIAEKLARRFNLPLTPVESQRAFDANFSTVRSPNPENGEALAAAVQLAGKISAELILAVDPDADRLAIAVRDGGGQLRLFSGNETAVFLAAQRLAAMKARGWLTEKTAPHGVLIRSIVTTPLLDDLAAHYGVRTLRTPIGFKWIGKKLEDYEKLTCDAFCGENGSALAYGRSGGEERRKLQLTHGRHLILGAEESGGYLAMDLVRDKDSHSALLMACEAYAALRRDGRSVEEFFTDIYGRFGYRGNRLHTVQFHGADGAEKIQKFTESLRTNPYGNFGNFAVERWTDCERTPICDGDGGMVAPQNLHFFELKGNYRVAVRASGTEPKVKFYLFSQEDGGDVPRARELSEKNFDHIIGAIGDDLRRRV